MTQEQVLEQQQKQNQIEILETAEADYYHDIQQEEEADCVGHEYGYLETLPSNSESYVQKLFVCLLCSKTKAVKIYHGVRE